jgi:aspartyl-tRNA(Asn)/glutamyl-tRNA(Gln) amidotransferase subunit A
METVAQLVRGFRSQRFDAVDLTEQMLDAIRLSDDQAIFINVLAERSLREAKAARKRQRAGMPASALDGVPMGWKDLFDIKGRVTTAGSVVLRSQPPASTDAALVAAAARAGMIAIGTLNMTEFAYSGIGLNPHYGTPRNPHDRDIHRSPGGSSSGSAVAVAKGLLPVAIGTDTGGSIRVPAAFNGLVGYKSSTGHYPMAGTFPLSATYDTLGPLAQTVEDCVLVDAVLRGLKSAKAKKADVRGRTFLVPTNVVLDGLDDAVHANFDAALSRISKAGGKVRKLAFPPFDAIVKLVSTTGNILTAEAYHVHRQRVQGPDAARMDARVVKRIKTGEKMLAVDLVEVMQQRQKLIAQATVFWSAPPRHMLHPPLHRWRQTWTSSFASTPRRCATQCWEIFWIGVGCHCQTAQTPWACQPDFCSMHRMAVTLMFWPWVLRLKHLFGNNQSGGTSNGQNIQTKKEDHVRLRH